MKRKLFERTIQKGLSAVLILGLFFSAVPVSAAPMPAKTELVSSVSSTSDSFSFDISIPWRDLSIEKVSTNQTSYAQVLLPEWDTLNTAAAPELPFQTKLVGVPHGATLSLDVRVGKSQTYYLPAPVLPVESQTIDFSTDQKTSPLQSEPEVTTQILPDPDLYQSLSPYPGKYAEVTNIGITRGQRIASIAVYPVQYDPAGQKVTIVDSLHITVNFEGGTPSDLQNISEPDSAVYEGIFSDMLLNYDQARAWRSESTDLVTEEQSLLSLAESTENLALTDGIQWSPPAQSWRIKIRETGMHQLDYSALSTAGVLSSSPNPQNFHLFYQGSEVAIEVVDQNSDGIFDDGDLLIFYAEAFSGKYTDENVYWLIVNDLPGLRMNSRSVIPGTGVIPTSHVTQTRFEENLRYYDYIAGPDSLERFMWKLFGSSVANQPGSWSYDFFLPSPVTSSVSSLTIATYGFTSYNEVFPDHRLVVYLNDQYLGEDVWDGFTWKYLTLNIPSNRLIAGTNTIKLEAPNDIGAGYDWMWIDWMTLDYANQFKAQEDVLSFKLNSGSWNTTLENFTTDELAFYDVQNVFAPEKLLDFSVSASAPYSAAFTDAPATSTQYIALAADAYVPVAATAIERDTSLSDLRSTSNGADYILISHPDFLNSAEALRARRQAQGLRSILVSVQDIYDEFSYGVVDPNAIRDFLAYTYISWQKPAPSYVVLIGDGNYDPKNYLGNNTPSFIPPYLANTDPFKFETAADNRYVTLEGNDRMPEMMLGRLPVTTAAALDALISKIIAYENSLTDSWMYQVLAVADNPDYISNYPADSDAMLGTYLPDNYALNKAYLGVPTLDPTVTKTAIVNNINNGVVLVNYIGHAAANLWASENIFSTIEANALTNGSKLPIILAMSCLEGSFHYPTGASLAEVVTQAPYGGAIASWSTSGSSVATGHRFLNSGFLWSYFQNGAPYLGQSVIQGKLNLWSSNTAQDLLDTYHLFGDPALKVARVLTAIPDSYSIDQNTPLNVSAPGVLSNDLNPENLTLSVNLVQNASSGTLTFNSDGSFVYTPNADFYGLDTFKYKIDAGTTESNTTTVSIRVRPPNSPPTDISLSATSFPENSPSNYVIGTFSTTDPDVADTHTYTLVTGEGSTNNGYFKINYNDNKLIARYTFNYEGSNEFSIRVRSTDKLGAYIEKVFTITVTDVPEAPWYTILDNTSVMENQPEGTLVANLTARDDDIGDTHTYSLENTATYPDNQYFTIIGSQLVTADVFDYEIRSTYTIFLRVTDQTDLYGEEEIYIEVLPEPANQTHIPLGVGWNLVSFKLQPTSTAITDVLSSIADKYTLVYAWDAASQAWLVHDPAGSSTLTNLDEKMGFWINMTSSDTLIVTGTPPVSTTIALSEGWNLVGYPSNVHGTLPEVLTSKGATNAIVVADYTNGALEPWHYHAIGAPIYANDLSLMTAGRGYWVNLSSAGTWTVPYE